MMETVTIEQRQAAERFFTELVTSCGPAAIRHAAWVAMTKGKSIEFCTMIFDAAMVHLAGTNHGDWLKSDYEYACKRIIWEVK